MDPLIQLGVAGGTLAVLRWFAGRVLDLFERRIEANHAQTSKTLARNAETLEHVAGKVDDIHAAVVPPQKPRLHNPGPGGAA